MRLGLIILCVVIFLTMSEVLLYLYPQASEDYNVFLKHYYLEDKINEILITLLFLLSVFQSKIKIIKAFAVFGFTIAFASTIDKVVFNVFEYLYTDIFLLIFATCIAYIVAYKNNE